MDFNAEEYWRDKYYKVWVVDIVVDRRSDKQKRMQDRKYVRARTKQGAIKTAKFHTHLKGRIRTSTRLATPSDLGAVEVKQKEAA